jgi:Asp-tRNA(Asn)/Glu-tRNA(Gln) amidotransferase B subunit
VEKKSVVVDREEFEKAVKKVLKAEPMPFKKAKTGKKKEGKVIPPK